MGNFVYGSGIRQTKDGVTISVHEAKTHYEQQILKKYNRNTDQHELYPFWKTTFPEDVGHLGPGVSLYFHHLKLFGAYYCLMSVFAVGICLLCMEANPGSDLVSGTSIGNIWKNDQVPDGAVGALDALMMLTLLVMIYLLPTDAQKLGDSDTTESEPEQLDDEKSKPAKPKNQTTYTSSQPRVVSWLPSQFSVRVGSIQPQKHLDILIKELWEFGELVEMLVMLKSGKVLLVHFANGNIDPVSVHEMTMTEYSRGKIPIERYGQHYKHTEARLEAVLKGTSETDSLLSKPVWSSTNFVLPDPHLCYVTYLHAESASDCLKVLKGCPCWCNCLAFSGWSSRFNMTAANPKEPSDILWSNLTYSWGNRTLRRFASLIISVALVSLNVFTLFNIQKFKNTHNLSKLEAILLGVIIVSINEFLKFALRALAYLERHYSHSELDTSIARSKFCVEVANNIFIIILLFGVPGTKESARWYNSGAMVVIAILASDAVVPNLVQFFHPKTRLLRIYKFYTAKTQRELNMEFEEPKLELWVRFTGLLGSNFIAMFFVSAVPMVLPLAAVAVGFQFLTEKYNVLRQYQRPVMLDTSMAVFVRHMLPFAVLFHCAFAILVYRSPVYEKIFELEYWGQWKLSDFGKVPVITPAQWPILGLVPITVLFTLYVYGGSLWKSIKSCFCGHSSHKKRMHGNYRTELNLGCESYTREVQKAFCYTQPVQIYPTADDLPDDKPEIMP